jgi:hypothetical protein
MSSKILIKPPMIFSKDKPVIKKKITINYPELTLKNKKKKKKLNHPPMIFTVKEIKKIKKPIYIITKKSKKKRMKNKKIFHKVHDFIDNFLLAYDDNYQKNNHISKKYFKNLLLYHFKELIEKCNIFDTYMLNIGKSEVLMQLFNNLELVYSTRYGWLIGNISTVNISSLKSYMNLIFCKNGEKYITYKYNYIDNYHSCMYYSKKRIQHSEIFKKYIWEELCKKVFHPKYNNILWNIDED